MQHRSKLHRRAFLAGTSAAAAGLLIPGLARAADDAPPIGLGFSLYGMKALKTADALRACADIGYDGVELALTPGWPTEPKLLSAADRRELRGQLSSHGLQLPALMENVHLTVDDATHAKNLERLKAAAELGHALSPARPPVIETVLGGRPNQWQSVKEQMAARLADWARVAESSQTVVAIKAHVSGAVHTPEAALWLWRQAGSRWIKLVYDYSHFQLRSFPLAESLRAMVPQTVFVHVKDSRGDADHVHFLLPGEGDVDYVQYLRLLREARYGGFVVVEVSGQIHGKPGYDAVAAARKSYQHLAPAFEEAGVQRV